MTIAVFPWGCAVFLHEVNMLCTSVLEGDMDCVHTFWSVGVALTLVSLFCFTVVVAKLR